VQRLDRHLELARHLLAHHGDRPRLALTQQLDLLCQPLHCKLFLSPKFYGVTLSTITSPVPINTFVSVRT
jgi:hypothetical protein